MRVRKKIAIIDYDMGNVRSIQNALRHVCKHETVVTAEAEYIRNADALILPGVGAYRDAMEHLHARGLVKLLSEEVVIGQKPILGICLGMQLLFESSEEGGAIPGLGWIEGNVVRLDPGVGYRVPHVGWNNLILKSKSDCFKDLGSDKNVYFVHSYFAKCPSKYVSSVFEYGKEFTASVEKGNIIGMQFHPEKSQKNGLAILSNFVESIEKASHVEK